MLPNQVSVALADGICRRQRIVRQLIVLSHRAHQVGRGLPVRHLLTQERVEHGSRCVQGLKLILDVQSVKYILRIIHGKMGAVGVIRRIPLCPGSDNVGIALLVMLGQTVGGGLSRRSLQVVKVAVQLLVIRQPFPHMVQHVLGELLAFPVGQVLSDPSGIKACLVHAYEADGGKMILKGAQISLGVGIQPLVQKLCYDLALGL